MREFFEPIFRKHKWGAMKTAIMQPYIFPYIGYWQLINAVDTFVMLDDVNFIMRGWINRNNILVNGKAHLFSIPLDKSSQNRLINEIRLKFSDKERENFLKTIRQAYKKAPYFDDFYPILSRVILNQNDDLVEFLHNSLIEICNYLGTNTKILISSQIDKDNSLKAEKRIIEICKRLNTTLYINLIGGKELYSPRDFENENIQLRFLNTNFEKITYRQFENDFVPRLSFLDVLMFNNKEEIQRHLSSYTLEEGKIYEPEKRSS